MANILVHIELKEEAASPASLAVLWAGRALASTLGATLYAVLPCVTPPSYDRDDIIAVLSRHGADKVILVTGDNHALPALWATQGQSLLMACERFRPRLLLLAASPAGQDIAPRIAVQLEAAFHPYARLLRQGEAIDLVSHVFRRRYLTRTSTRQVGTTVATLLWDDVPPPTIGDEEAEVIVIHGPTARGDQLKLSGQQRIPPTDPALGPLVVGGGAGLPDPESVQLVHRLAAVLGGAPTTATGDASSHDLVVGLDGIALAAQLYLTFGLSGGDAHLSGLDPRTVVVATASDPEDSIFQVARFGVVADPQQALPQLLSELEPGEGS